MTEDMLMAMAFESAKISVSEEAKINEETNAEVIARQFYEKYQNALEVLYSLEKNNQSEYQIPQDPKAKLNPYQL